MRVPPPAFRSLALVSLLACVVVGSRRGLPAAPVVPLEHLHVLLVLDDNDPVLGPSIRKDRERVLALLASNLPAGAYTATVLEGNRATRGQVRNYLDRLHLGKDEGVLFYFSGQGGGKTSDRLSFVLSGDGGVKLPRSEVRQALQRTGAGLVVLWSDCGSNKRVGGQGSEVDPMPARTGAANGADTTLSLLLRSSRGVIDLTAASPGERAHGDEKNGGVFTRALCAVLSRPASSFPREGADEVGWADVIPEIKKRTAEGFDRLRKDSAGAILPGQTQVPWALAGADPPGAVRFVASETKTYAVVSLINKTKVDVEYEYRWKGDKQWNKATLVPDKGVPIFKVVPAGTREATLLAKFNTIINPATGRPFLHAISANIWTGPNEPKFEDGKLYPLNPGKGSDTEKKEPEKKEPEKKEPEKKDNNARPPVKVHLTKVTDRPGEDVVLKLEVEVETGVKPEVTVWMEDYRFPMEEQLTLDSMGRLVKEVVIKRSMLRAGTTQVRAVVETPTGDRLDAPVTINNPVGEVKSRLFGLCVGNNGYDRVRGKLAFGDLACAENDARTFAEYLKKQKEGKLYTDVEVKVLLGAEVKAVAILDYLEGLQKQVKPDDRLVLYLAGMADCGPSKEGQPLKGSWSLVCVDSNFARPDTLVAGKKLAAALAALPCQKLVIVDTACAGLLGPLLPEGKGMLFLGSCQAEQESYEPMDGKNSLFARVLFGALGLGAAGEKVPGPLVHIDDLAKTLTGKLPALVRSLDPAAHQEPVTRPEKDIPHTAVFVEGKRGK
jgi:hypothetical protein